MKRSKSAAFGMVIGISSLVTASGLAQPAATETKKAAPIASTPGTKTPPALPDLLKEPTLFVVAYAHLDTQWRWCYPQSIREYLPATLHVNFDFFKKYPNYVFNFSGSRRYQMMREYYPEDYARLKAEVAAGKWFPCGSSVDENDANVPSGESYVRHVLYGNRFFRQEFGVASDEYMLPDCFGFPAAIPSLLAHCGVTGFSTQKLTWNAVVPIPFKVGVWEGPDGRGVVAALDPGSYGGEVLENLANSDGWAKRIAASGKVSGVLADYHYYGTGDQGGGPTDRSVAMMETSIATKGKQKIVSGPADQLFHAITPEMRAKLPTYKGELQLTEHSAGSVTSQAYMKRWNRKNELLADAAERASVAAAWLGGRAYPSAKLEEAWTLVLGSQMHDILPGTSHPRAYDYSWNDEILAANEFAAVLTDGAGVVAGAMDTTGSGTSLVLFNPLSVDREDVVEAEIPGDFAAAKSVVVTGPDGKPVAAQILSGNATMVRVAFLAKVPSVGFASFSATLGTAAPTVDPTLHADNKSIENSRYLVKINDNGDVASITDKKAKREMLSAPAGLGLHYENPKNWPAWNQDWADRQLPVKEVVGAGGAGGAGGAAKVRVVENGPARVTVEIVREVGGSTFTQRLRLAGGQAGDRLEFDCSIDWAARERSLRAAFPLSVSNPKATYDIQTGTIERGNGQPHQYEYAFQQWFDLTDTKGDYGVTVMSDSKYGADKPSDTTVRLTLLHTPGVQGGYQDQGTQDLGRHHILYAISGHEGDWRKGRSAEQAARLNQPILAFRTSAHAGALGKSFSLVKVSDPNVMVSAIKKAEDGDEVVLRLRELSGKAVKGVKVSAGKVILSAREVDGQERPMGAATVKDGALVADIGGYELRAYAVKLGEASVKAVKTQSTSVELAFDTDVASTRAKRGDGAMDAKGSGFPAEQFPATIVAEDATFTLGSAADGKKNAVACRGQEITLPSGEFDRLYLLAASSDGDVNTSVEVDGKKVDARFRDWSGMLGQWDRRIWLGEVPELTFNWNNDLGGIEPGYVKPETVAWYNSHYSTPKGDTYYQFCYMYKVAIDLPKGAKTVRLPNNDRVKVFAATAVNTGGLLVVPAGALTDTLNDHAQDSPRIVVGSGPFKDATEIRIEPRMYWTPGSLRYTLDGSAPTQASPVYAGPIAVNRPTTVTAAVVGSGGASSPVATVKVDVTDVTPPTVKGVSTNYMSPVIRVEFSEPLDDSAASAKNYLVEPSIAVKSVTLSADHKTATVELASAPEVDKTYHLNVKDIKDASPAHNASKAASLEVRVTGPVYKLEAVTKEMMGKAIKNVPGLPVKGGDKWTMSMFVKTDKQPDNRTIIAGFGKCEDGTAGIARYFSKFANGLQFWVCNRDVPSKTPLELGKWQMLTATYDGTVLRMFKDGVKVGERKVQLADDENVVNFAPVDPWEKKRTFEGEIRGVTIWNSALGEEAIRSLKESTRVP
ncbi:MAG: glycoside hydrolase family 38 C-terminal domain-containing protein [Planctomycetota bacterium]